MFGGDESVRAPLYERMSIELLGATEGGAHNPRADSPTEEIGRDSRLRGNDENGRGNDENRRGDDGNGNGNGGGSGQGDALRASSAGGARSVTLHTTRGDAACVLHRPAEERGVGVVWAAGARGGFDGPANGLYGRLAERLAARGAASLRVDYRRPGDLDESTLDVLAGVWRMANIGYSRVALVGHSFGGGVALSAARYTSHARGVAALASQTAGAEEAALLGGRPLLLVHGEADAVLPVGNSETIYGWASGPKRLVTYPGAGHGLRECAAQLDETLEAWLCETLGIGG